jgi:hypothetical protein
MKKKERAALEEIQVSGNKRKRRPEPQQQRTVAIHDACFRTTIAHNSVDQRETITTKVCSILL